jgi:hypothetical protein
MRRGGSKANLVRLSLWNHPSRDPLRDHAALTQEGNRYTYIQIHPRLEIRKDAQPKFT